MVDAIGASARSENIACARRLAAIAEPYRRPGSTGPGRRGPRVVAHRPWAAVAAGSRPPNRSPRGRRVTAAQRGLPTPAAAQGRRRVRRGRGRLGTVQMIVTRTLLAVEPAVMAAIDAEVADTIRAWGGLSIYKTQTAIDRIVERHDPEARRRTESAVRSRCVDIKHGSKVATHRHAAHRRCRAAGSAIDRDVQIRLRRRSARYRSAAGRRARRAGGRTNGTGVRLRIHRMPRRGQRFPAFGCRACGGRGGDARDADASVVHGTRPEDDTTEVITSRERLVEVLCEAGTAQPVAAPGPERASVWCSAGRRSREASWPIWPPAASRNCDR